MKVFFIWHKGENNLFLLSGSFFQTTYKINPQICLQFSSQISYIAVKSMNEAEFVLFLDPQTEEFFSYCEKRQILIKEYAPEGFREHIIRDLKIARGLLEDEPWGIKQVSDFQRRPPPIDFLTFRKFRYPIYTTHDAFHNCMLESYRFNQEGALMKPYYKNYIRARIYLGSIQPQLQSVIKNHPDKNFQYIDQVHIKILTSANQMIRTVCRCILQDFKVVITTNSPHNKLVLKRVDHEEYLYGNEAIGNYNCVRQFLKEDKQLEFQIFQTDINKGREQFSKFVFYRSVESISRGYFEPFPWMKLVPKDHCGFLIWRQPKNFKIVKPQQMHESEDDIPQLLNLSCKIKNKIQQLTKVPKFQRFLLKDTIKIMIEKRRIQIEKQIIDVNKSIIYSGECQYLFSFEIKGITNFSELLVSHKSTDWESRSNRKPFPKLFSFKQQNEQNIIHLSTAQKRYNYFSTLKKKSNMFVVPYLLSVQAFYYYNGQPDGLKGYETPVTLITSDSTPLNYKVKCQSCVSEIMLETSLVLKVKAHSKEGESVICGVGVLKLFDEWGYLKQGEQKIQLISQEDICPMKLGCHNETPLQGEDLSQIVVVLPKYKHPVRWTLRDPHSLKFLGFISKRESNNNIDIEEKMNEVMQLLSYDPIRMLNYTQEEKAILRTCKRVYKNQSDKLINYLYAIDWKDCKQVWKAYEALQDWAPLKPMEALFLLTPRISDQKVRYFAVKVLSQMNTNDFCLYANQITQALVSFQTHDNPLFYLIIERCSNEPFLVGYEYFWQFKSRLSEQITNYRFHLYFQAFVFTCPRRQDFYKQMQINNHLFNLNQELRRETDKVGKLPLLLLNVQKNFRLIDPSGFNFPIRPEKNIKYILPSLSKIFNSTKSPFVIACTYRKVNEETLKNIAKEQRRKFQQEKDKRSMDNEEMLQNSKVSIKKQFQKPYYVMFKCNDDIKRDHLILQIFTIFNNFWILAGLNLRLNIYRVLSTGNKMGFIEAVDEAQSISVIHQHFSSKREQAYNYTATFNYLRSKNPKDEEFLAARENYICSNAAYLVATYILGISDSEKYMVHSDGRYFLIGFKYILGEFKKQFKNKKEIAPFFFTVENTYTMGGEKSQGFRRFKFYCKQAYNILRKNSKNILHLMSMIVGTSLIENYKSLEYMIGKLHLEMSDTQAAEHLINQIRKNVEDQSRKYPKMTNG